MYFFECEEARRVWEQIGWEKTVIKTEAKNFKEWLGCMLKQMEKHKLEQTVMLLWMIWKSRNEKVFQGLSWGAEKICSYGLSMYQELQEVQGMERVTTHNIVAGWCPPENDFLKINVDGAYSTKGAGIGIVVRNDKGELDVVMVERVEQCCNVEHVETIAFLKAIQFAKDFGITHFVVEGDAANVVNKINMEGADLSVIGHLIEGIKQMLVDFPSVKSLHVSRKANEPTRQAAKAALEMSGCLIWFTGFPML